MEKIEKSILKTAGITFGALFVLLVVVVLALSIFAPKTMYNFSQKLGFKNLSFTYAESQYNKSHDINDLHTLIYSAYDIDNNGAIIKYSEILFALPEYDDFIDYINKQNATLNSNITARITLTNENNYLKNKYVKALCDNNKFDIATAFALNELENSQTWTLAKRTTWLLNPLLSYQAKQTNPNFDFLKTQNSQSQTFIYLAENYLDKLLSAQKKLKEELGNSNQNTANTQTQLNYQILTYDLRQYLAQILFLQNKTTLEVHDFAYYQTAYNEL